MTRIDIVKNFVLKSLWPITLAVILYNGFVGVCTADGITNYMYLFMLCGIPFGIKFMFTLPVFLGNMGMGIFAVCMNIAIGALIGGFVLVGKLIYAVCYIPITVVRLVIGK